MLIIDISFGIETRFVKEVWEWVWGNDISGLYLSGNSLINDIKWIYIENILCNLKL